jgi:hypothetical protein
MDGDGPYTSFAKFSIVLVASMLPSLRSCITEY